MCEICQNWARDGRDSLAIGGKLLMPNHHPNCPHYNDSLMEVWKVTDGATNCYVEPEPDAKDTAQNEGGKTNTITKIQMHREIFENLPEFDGF
jgi:hypothetical protein